ncbi:DUF423 domain-containing protein [Aliarcobacter skirrowii]|uniref:DUF423 domain-containing protein n=1 Tax=Aliarcobacter skirrowii TaxID=28200 RepID=UPI0029B41B06|nr:DUF423 domain-containing protein [Aliarcobacter skirrowii]MDX4027780.1 DUF423 domain-containing protein [Aliarcobacter skirrowii]
MVYDSRARKYLAFCFFLFASAIALGAFGAHGLKKVLTPEMLKVFHTGVEYQFYNTLALFVITFLTMLRAYNSKLKLAQNLLIIGTLIFSVSLYILTIFNIPKLGMITPIGGTLQIIAYIIAAYAVLKDNK